MGLGLGGCNRPSMCDVTGSIGGSDSLPASDAALRQYAEEWGRRYDTNRTDKRIGMNYARALRALRSIRRRSPCCAAWRSRNPRDMEVLGAYGKALADDGKLQEASKVLENAHTPERPNWSILSAQGSVADQMGDHERARELLWRRAEDPAERSDRHVQPRPVLCAVAQSADGRSDAAQAARDQPAADMRVRQNLALVLALQGKFGEAENVLAPRSVAGRRRLQCRRNPPHDLAIQHLERDPQGRRENRWQGSGQARARQGKGRRLDRRARRRLSAALSSSRSA